MVLVTEQSVVVAEENLVLGDTLYDGDRRSLTDWQVSQGKCELRDLLDHDPAAMA